MNVLDFIILGFTALCFLAGFFRGFWKQLLSVAGIILVVYFTSLLTPVVANWFAGTSLSTDICVIIAMCITLVVFSVVWGIAAWLLGKLLKHIRLPKILSRLLGGLLGIVDAYLVFAIVFALVQNTGINFLAAVKGWTDFYTSWFGNHLYSNNFFGDWVIRTITNLV